MRSVRFGRAAGLLAGSLMVAVACGLGSGSTSGTGSGPIIVGVSAAMSGDKGDAGTNSYNGYLVWQKVVNDGGGLLGRKVDIKHYDNGSLAATAVSQYQHLVTVDRADVLLGPFSGSLVAATEVVAAQYGKVFVEGSGGTPEVFQRHIKNVFFVQPAPIDQQAEPLVNWIKSLPASQRPTTAGYPSVDDDFAKAVNESVRTALEPAGVRTVYQQVYPPTQTDLAAIGAQLKAAGADLLVQGNTADQDGAAAVKGYSAVGYQPKVTYFSTGPDSTSTWSQLLGSKVDATMTSLDWLQESSVTGNSTFVKTYLKMFPNKDNLVPSEAAEAYAAGQVLAAAINATSSVDNAKLIDWLHKNKVQSIEGNFGWDADGSPVGGQYNLVQWQNGHLVVVYPPNAATNGTKPTYPKPAW